MSKPDGGPAFPSEFAASADRSGMSLRDWFAGQALTGILASPHHLAPENEGQSTHLAMRLYQMADALLAERAK